MIKKYYTIEEDAVILKILADIKNTTIKGVSLIKLLKLKLGKTEESLRNRIKRHLKRLS